MKNYEKNYEIAEENIFCSGHAACPGCAMALSTRYILNTLGKETVSVIPPSCMGVIMGHQPYSSFRIPIYKTVLASSAASAVGIKRALRSRGKDDVKVIAIAGDGGSYDIGLQALSSAAEQNEDIIYFCLDNEGYMNTGAQKSSSTPHYAYTTSTPAGKMAKKKNMVEIMAAHQIPYLATASIGFLADLTAKVQKAKEIKGTKVIIALTPCIDGWGLASNAVAEISRLAVFSGVFPLYEVEHGTKYAINHGSKEIPVDEYLSKQKRYKHLTKEQTAEIQMEVNQHWQRLQELAAIRPLFSNMSVQEEKNS
jgi:pyruvate ferredoxin oxidoreductase beta subunit/2-oxoisovalerate ferredoxin oxidoreductase beta subunit